MEKKSNITIRHIFKDYYKVLLFGIAFFAIMALLAGLGYASPIGCMPYNASIIKCWNNGSIENTTYFSIDGLQMANKLDRFSWTTYDYGLRYNNNFYPIGRLNPSFLGIRTDNQTYYELVWSYHFSMARRSAWVNYTLTQSLNDDYVNATFSFYPYTGRWRNLNQPVYVYRSMTGIDVWNDAGVDVINFVNGSGVQGFDLNVSVDERLPLMQDYLTVGQINRTGSIQWLYDGQSDGWLKSNHPGNADVYWWRHFTDNVEEGTIYEITDRWIDADPCVVTCPRGVSYGFTRMMCEANSSQSRCDANTGDLNALFKYRVYWNSLMGGGYCGVGSGCVINTSRDTSGDYDYVEIPYMTSTVEDVSVCTSYSVSTCEQDTIQWPGGFGVSYSNSRLFNVSCRREGTHTLVGYFEHYAATGSPLTNNMSMVCPADSTDPVVNLLGPSDNESTTSTSYQFSCEGWDLYPVVNVSLYANFSGTWEINETYDINDYTINNYTFTSNMITLTPGTYSWNCEYCDNNDNCGMNAANYTLIIKELSVPTQRTKIQILQEQNKCNFLCWLTKLFSRRNK